MYKTLKIQIFSDGRIQAEVKGVKGKACTDYIKILEELLDAETVDSQYTDEYYQTQQILYDEINLEKVKGMN